MTKPLSNAFRDVLSETLRPLLDEYRSAIRADFLKALAEMQKGSSGPQPAALPAKLAGVYVGKSERTIRRWEAEGRLKAVRVGGSVLFRVEDLDALLNNHQK